MVVNISLEFSTNCAAGAGKSARNKKQSITVTAEELLTNKEYLTLSLSGKVCFVKFY